MPIRSMTGFAQVKRQVSDALAFTLSLKSVNHRFLDLQFRLPSDMDALELKLRRVLKEKLARGHVDLTLSLERGGGAAMSVNQELVAGYIAAFRQAAAEFQIVADPDLNAVFRMPGALGSATTALDESFESAVLGAVDEAIAQLNAMREEEGRGIERELRDRIARLAKTTSEIEQLREAVTRARLERIQTRMKELLEGAADQDRILQEAALQSERSDIQEEIARMNTHLEHFLGLMGAKEEIGKKMDFLLQEMNREANTMLSKTAGVSGEGMRITELGLAMKSEIEKLREQVQNIE